MDPLEAFDQLSATYRSFVESTTSFSSEAIRKWVAAKTQEGRLYWRDPYISVQGEYAVGGPLAEIEGLDPRVHELIAERIPYFEAPRAHQSAAIEKALAGRNVVVATGTGSGKSFAFFVPVISQALAAQAAGVSGTKAVLVYPMNALANAQYEDLVELIDGTGLRICNYQRKLPAGRDEALERWHELTGRRKPRDCEVTDRGTLRKSAAEGGGADILITNYMMLELALTRHDDRHLFPTEHLNSLRTLVLDEIHTYSGRQGADVACLIRRFKEHVGAGELCCIGTSATVDTSGEASGGEAIAEFASALFGEPFDAGDVIVDHAAPPSVDAESDPGAAWLARTLSEETLRIDELRDRYAAEVGGDADEALRAAMASGTLQPKAHAFFSQGRPISLCLRSAGGEDPHLSERGDSTCAFCDAEGVGEAPSYPVVFCIGCGQEHLVAARVAGDLGQHLVAREFEGTGEVEGEPVYVCPGHWDEDDVPADPDALKKDGTARKGYEGAVPRNTVVCGECGALGGGCAHGEGSLRPVALVARPFLLCPSCGIRHSRAREFNKFRQVGLIGRASATDVLISGLVDELDGDAKRRLLAFCDNRQDSSFQFSHLNAFHRRLHFRRALHAGLAAAGEPIGATEAAWAALEAMKAADAVPDYAAAQESRYGKGAQKAEKTYARYLAFAVLLEVSGYARLNQPSLLDAGAAEVVYDGLAEVAADAGLWDGLAELAAGGGDLRFDYLAGLLDIVRRARAFDGDAFLDGERFGVEVVDRLRETAHCHDPSFPSDRPAVFSDESLNPRRFNVRRLSTATASTVKWTKRFFELEKSETDAAQRIVSQAIEVLASPAVGLLVDAGNEGGGYVLDHERVLVGALAAPAGQRCPRCGARYRFRADRPCVGCMKVKATEERSGDAYSLGEYRAPLGARAPILAEEHSAQLSDDQRVRAENQFNDAEDPLNVLVCTPTMELGIDVGNLSAAYMRNVPPSPANYAQRAGRAGRHGQSSLVVTFCGAGGRRGPHDRYFFERPEQMISGRIAPPRFLLDSEALIGVHLNSLVLQHLDARLGTPGQLLDLAAEGSPLRADVRQTIEGGVRAQRDEIAAAAGRVFEQEREALGWLTGEWLERRVDGFAESFDAAWSRFRFEYQAGREELEELHAEAQAGKLDAMSARRRESLEGRLDDMREGRGDHYVYSRLAADGFLPNYAFPRRAAVAHLSDRKESIARARTIALREFAPGNSIYYRGVRYQVERAIVPGGGEHWEALKRCDCGVYLRGSQVATTASCPGCGASLMGSVALDSALELPDALARRRRRVSADEEERQRKGYRIGTSYALGGAVRSGKFGPLGVRYAHNGSLLLVNEGSRASDERGFSQCTRCRQWEPDPRTHFGPEAKCGAAEEALRTGIVLFTEGRHDMLELTLPEGTTHEAAISLAQALELGIEVAFQLDGAELGSSVAGSDEVGRRILLYETDEGGIGVLHRLGQGREWGRVIDRTLGLLHVDAESGEEQDGACVSACYDCLLTFYNQQWHGVLDRRPAVETLLAVRGADFEGLGGDEDRYEALTATAEGMEGDVLAAMREQGLPAPDSAHETIMVDGVPVLSADLYYAKQRICVMCDGTPHDKESVQVADEAKRAKVKSRGYFVVVVDYRNAGAGIDELAERLGV